MREGDWEEAGGGIWCEDCRRDAAKECGEAGTELRSGIACFRDEWSADSVMTAVSKTSSRAARRVRTVCGDESGDEAFRHKSAAVECLARWRVEDGTRPPHHR